MQQLKQPHRFSIKFFLEEKWSIFRHGKSFKGYKTSYMPWKVICDTKPKRRVNIACFPLYIISRTIKWNIEQNIDGPENVIYVSKAKFIKIILWQMVVIGNSSNYINWLRRGPTIFKTQYWCQQVLFSKLYITFIQCLNKIYSYEFM